MAPERREGVRGAPARRGCGFGCCRMRAERWVGVMGASSPQPTASPRGVRYGVARVGQATRRFTSWRLPCSEQPACRSGRGRYRAEHLRGRTPRARQVPAPWAKRPCVTGTWSGVGTVCDAGPLSALVRHAALPVFARASAGSSSLGMADVTAGLKPQCQTDVKTT